MKFTLDTNYIDFEMLREQLEVVNGMAPKDETDGSYSVSRRRDGVLVVCGLAKYVMEQAALVVGPEEVYGDKINDGKYYTVIASFKSTMRPALNDQDGKILLFEDMGLAQARLAQSFIQQLTDVVKGNAGLDDCTFDTDTIVEVEVKNGNFIYRDIKYPYVIRRRDS